MQSVPWLRRLQGPGLLLVSGTALFLMMANEGRTPLATLWGLACLLVFCFALFRSLGLLGGSGARDVQISDTWLAAVPGESPLLAPVRTLPVAALIVLAFTIAAPKFLPGAVLAGLLLLLPAALRRPGLLVFVLTSGLLLPTLGAFYLWDPWETHYGEVAREVLARDDWISLWWAQDRWFWSKPILIFWAEALAWNATLVPFTADSQFHHSEWILRLPIFAFAITALLAVYHVVSRRFSTRAGMLSALVLASTPYFAFLTHQAITDMYLVASATVAVMLFMLAVAEDPEREVASYRVVGLSLSAQHLVIGMIVCLALPQILYLASRNVTLIDGFLFAWHGDDFFAGSADNGDVPGNSKVKLRHPAIAALWAQPLAQALVWSVCLLLIIRSLRRERRAQALQMVGFYLFCALAFMGKGLPGIALPGLVALLYLLATGRWSLLLTGRLRVAPGIGTIACVALPWFVAMFMRHGPAFTDRILIHDHINRLTTGVHGDKGNIQYFLEQLGTGLFPWIALVPAALVVWLGASNAEDDERRRAVITIGLWFLATFTLFSAMTTKFHHYIFPAVPPAAILMGLALDRLLGNEARSGSARTRLGTVLGALSALPLTLGLGGLFGDLRGVIPSAVPQAERSVWVLQHASPAIVSAGLVAAAAGMLLVASRLQGRPPDVAGGSGATRSEELLLRGALVAGAVLVALAGRDLSWTTSVRPAGNERLAHLFIYNYERPWPEELDYRAVLSGFACTAVLATALAAFTRLRPVMTQALVGLGLLFGVFCLDVYMIDATRHWTQGHLVERYYRQRKGPEEPLLAWQMNWKGENYYTGNRVHVFQDLDNKKISAWLDEHKGTHAFFVFEHKRLSRFKRLMQPRKVTTLSTERDCNKFVLAEADL